MNRTREQVVYEGLTSLKIIHLNINGADQIKRGKLRYFLQSQDPDIMALSETHLKDRDGLEEF